MHAKILSVAKFLLTCSLLVVANGKAAKNSTVPNFLADAFIKFARNFWKQNDADPLVIPGYSKGFKNKTNDLNLTITMLTEKHMLRGISNVARKGDTKLSHKKSSIDLKINCTIMYLRWYFNYAIHFSDRSGNFSWISIGKKEHYILDPEIGLKFSLDLKSGNVSLKKLSVRRDFVVSEGKQVSVGRKKPPVPKINETRYAIDFRDGPRKEFVRGLIEKKFKFIVQKLLNSITDAML